MSDKLGINNIAKPVYDEIMKEVPNVQDVSDIQDMSDSVIDKLKVGDVVAKKTGNQKHCYIVTYKEEKHGICLSYFDGSGYLETISYDYTNGHWVFNSKDVTQVPNVEGAPSGTIQDVLGLNASGKLVKGAVSGGTKLYLHDVLYSNEFEQTKELYIITTSNIVLQDYQVKENISDFISGYVEINSGQGYCSLFQAFDASTETDNMCISRFDNSVIEFVKLSSILSGLTFIRDTVTEL